MRLGLRAWLWQAGALLIVLAIVAWLANNLVSNLAQRGITVGFDFLSRAARFPISESLLPYSSTDTFAWAFLVGFSNTLILSLIVILFSTIAGFALALARRSRNALASCTASAFVEVTRNTPLVVQLLFWYAAVTYGLPPMKQALNPIAGIFLTDRGIYLPSLHWTAGSLEILYPVAGRFNFVGGMVVTPEVVAILLGLILYSTAFTGEIIRGGIDAIGAGQWEAGRATGLTDRQTLRLVIVPQALRVIIPPMTSQYVNIIKNSTLALIVGFPELNFVTATTINQTGQAIEGVLILMTAFLLISASASWIMSGYHARIALPHR